MALLQISNLALSIAQRPILQDIDLSVVKAEYTAANEALRAFGERHEGPEFAELERDKEWAEARIKAHEMASAR